MARDFHIEGETLVRVRFGAHISGNVRKELGLAQEDVIVTPNFRHRDVIIDDFGPNIPPEILWQLADVRIRMTLIHFDEHILDICTSESMAGGVDAVFKEAGTMAPAGHLMGGGGPLLSSGNHFIQVNLAAPQLGIPWRFFASYLCEQPLRYPLGTRVMAVGCNWRAIPYTPLISGSSVVSSASGNVNVFSALELISSGVRLWDRQFDDD